MTITKAVVKLGFDMNCAVELPSLLHTALLTLDTALCTSHSTYHSLVCSIYEPGAKKLTYESAHMSACMCSQTCMCAHMCSQTFICNHMCAHICSQTCMCACMWYYLLPNMYIHLYVLVLVFVLVNLIFFGAHTSLGEQRRAHMSFGEDTSAHTIAHMSLVVHKSADMREHTNGEPIQAHI